MTPNDDTQDEKLLARYRQASAADAAGPSDAVREAILAESRRVADELAKQAPPRPFDVSRPAANDSRWKITAFGTAGAALLAALLFAPRYWENAPPAQMSAVSSAPAPAATQAQDRAEQPKFEEMKPHAAPSYTEPARQSPSERSLQEVVVTRRPKSSKSVAAPNAAGHPRQLRHPAWRRITRPYRLRLPLRRPPRLRASGRWILWLAPPKAQRPRRVQSVLLVQTARKSR